MDTTLQTDCTSVPWQLQGDCWQLRRLDALLAAQRPPRDDDQGKAIAALRDAMADRDRLGGAVASQRQDINAQVVALVEAQQRVVTAMQAAMDGEQPDPPAANPPEADAAPQQGPSEG